MPRIQYTTPAGSSGVLDLTAERMTLGRAGDNALVLADDSVSSHHGEFAYDNGAWFFTDLGSTNGTKVSGERVESLEMAEGGSFTLGDVECVFFGDEAAPAARGAASRTVSSGDFSSRAYDRSLRTGFGTPKARKKAAAGGSGALIAFGVLGLLACGAAAYMAMQLA